MTGGWAVGDDSLVEVGTFLARRWSGNPAASVELSDRAAAGVRGGRITLHPPARLAGGGLDRYRQFRASLWRESMRMARCSRVLSGEHAFGFMLGALESRRVEAEGAAEWLGMGPEIAFARAYEWLYRPQLGSVYGRARMVEAFYQELSFGGTKGEIAPGRLERAREAAALGREALKGAPAGRAGTAWLEARVPGMVRALGIDSLLTVPLALPWMRPSMALTEEELLKAIARAGAGGGRGPGDPRAVRDGGRVRAEYEALAAGGAGAGPGPGEMGMRVPAGGAGAGPIYDPDLIGGLKARFKAWRTGWSESHARAGDEFDAEAHLEGHWPFITDSRRSVRSSVAMLLDHSSSVAGGQAEYKKATLALCEVLAYLRVRFAVYAFSTEDREVVCWLVKPAAQGWNGECARRLARISAGGSTPLADVYGRLLPALQAMRPEAFLTLTDGEPSDPGAVRRMIRAVRALGPRVVALGLGPDTVRATAIASNLAGLGYDRAVAVSRLADMPARVLGLLDRAA